MKSKKTKKKEVRRERSKVFALCYSSSGTKAACFHRIVWPESLKIMQITQNISKAGILISGLEFSLGSSTLC